MELIDLNDILDRKSICENIKEFLSEFEKNKNNLSCKRGIYNLWKSRHGKKCFHRKFIKRIKL